MMPRMMKELPGLLHFFKISFKCRQKHISKKLSDVQVSTNIKKHKKNKATYLTQNPPFFRRSKKLLKPTVLAVPLLSAGFPCISCFCAFFRYAAFQKLQVQGWLGALFCSTFRGEPQKTSYPFCKAIYRG